MRKIKKKEQPSGFRRYFIGGACLLLGAVAVPSAIYYNQLKEIKKNQDQMLTALKERVEVNVKSYMESATLAGPGDSTTNINSGVITKGNAKTKEDITASEISALLTDDVIRQIEGDVLNELYTNVGTIINEKYSATLSEKELDTISKQVSALITEDIYEYKKDIHAKLGEIDNFYTTVNELTGGMNTQLNGLSNDMQTLNVIYTEQFATLTEKDALLQEQLTEVKATQNSMDIKQGELESKITTVSKDSTNIQTDLQKRIDALRTNSESGDTELANTLIKAQNDINKRIEAGDNKVYDNATKIIELTDKITNLDGDMSEAIRVLSEQTGSDTEELYSTLTQLQTTLNAGDSDLSSAINTEMNERSKAVAEILSLIDSLSSDTTSTQDDIYLEIERKSRALASSLATTSSTMKTEYTSLIESTSANLSAKVDETNFNLNNKIDNTSSNLNSKIDNTNTTLSSQINSTKETLTQNINTTSNNLTSYINAENLQTREDMAAAIASLQNEINELNAKIAELENDKLNKSDSTRYNYSTTDGNTIRITIPDTNPNLSRE